jgi:hypothetical protein
METETMEPLTKAQHVLVEGVVYCLDHGSVHDETTDPYGYGRPDCGKSEHRRVYAALRRGDWPEAG